ncbi:aspartic peptidase domain-containing protein [Apodospora peruviana]|uniref:Aspartic peptidase domain-containing protein n=1 Tax=Apodospora peruviana TaxID=516989 RepID=A0AAE0HVK1_9PEZI|nr:aspartic peptidase domain-containing protein [Apodospora peruviana]
MRIHIATIGALVLSTTTTCRSATIPDELPEPPTAEPPPQIGPRGPKGDWTWEARKPGYVRMPVSRHVFNGTGRWPWGWHWQPPPGAPNGWPGYPNPSATYFSTATRSSSSLLAVQSTSSSLSTTVTQPSVRPRANSDRRWGWQHLEDMGGIAYILQLEIGTPPQKIKVFIDTGSYELWVNPKCNTSASETLCQSYGNYYPNKSNSSAYVGGDFAVTYGTGAVKGSYWSDIMSIAMFQIPQVQFAVANDSNYTFSGILGLGYSYPYSINYPSILNLMVSQKLISAPIFSLGLGGDQDGFSEIIFGGINKWKFAGPLEPVPIWPPISQQDPHWIQYWVNITSVGMTKPGQPPVIYTPRDSFTMPTLIDTGSTLSYIREDLVAQIGQQFQASVDAQGNYIVDCAYRNITSGTVDFGFNKGRMVINVRYKDFIYQQYPGHCMLGVQPADVGSTNYVLGDTFIRGAYLVFDQQSDVVWMNQYYNCGDGVVSVGEKARDTKGVVGAC